MLQRVKTEMPLIASDGGHFLQTGRDPGKEIVLDLSLAPVVG